MATVHLPDSHRTSLVHRTYGLGHGVLISLATGSIRLQIDRRAQAEFEMHSS